jgi:hypothetical protein
MFERIKKILGFKTQENASLPPDTEVGGSYHSIYGSLDSGPAVSDDEELGGVIDGGFGNWYLTGPGNSAAGNQAKHLFDGDNLADLYSERLNDVYLDAEKISRFDKFTNFLKRIVDYPISIAYTVIVGGKGSILNRSVQFFSNIYDAIKLYQGNQPKIIKTGPKKFIIAY